MTLIYKIRLKKGDTVVLRAGKDRGKTGEIVAVHPRLNKVTVKGLNIVKRTQKPSRTQPQGGIVELTKPIWVSKLSLVDPASKKTTRIGYKISDKSKVRIAKSTGKEIK